MTEHNQFRGWSIILFLLFGSLFFIGDFRNSALALEPCGLIYSFNDGIATLELTEDTEGLSVIRNEYVLIENSFFTLQIMPGGATTVIKGNFSKDGDDIIQSFTIADSDMSGMIRYHLDNDSFLAITAELTSDPSVTTDRGFLFKLHIPVEIPQKWVWEPGPDNQVPMNSDPQQQDEALWYPLTALTSEEGGIALAVPVTHPAVCQFDRNPSNQVSLEFWLGTSPLTNLFPNAAKVKMLLWCIDRKWGFRQALQNYFHHFPDRYQMRNPKVGLWSTGTPEGLAVTSPFLFHEFGNIFFSLEDSSGRKLGDQLPLDQQYNWQMFPYLIAGQMSRINLNELPENFQDIDQFLDSQPVVFPPQQLKQYEDLSLGKNDYSASLLASRIEDADGNPLGKIRNTVTQGFDPVTGELVKTWSTLGNQVSFTVNPSPTLVLNGIPGHGKRMLDWVNMCLQRYPQISGIYVDSMRWGDYDNYRREHFAFSTLPLACDSNGRVFLPNAWGHYEFLQQLSWLLHSKGKLLMINSYYYKPESFFVDSFADVLGQEQNHLDVGPAFWFSRALSGPRVALGLRGLLGDLSHDQVKQHLNVSMSLGILPSAWPSYFALSPWVNADESFATGWGGKPLFARDATLWEQIFALIQPLGSAQWQPMTQAWCDTEQVYVERFSKDSNHTFTLYRKVDGNEQPVTLHFEKGLIRKTHFKAWALPSGNPLEIYETPDTYTVSVMLPQGPSALAVININLSPPSVTGAYLPLLLD